MTRKVWHHLASRFWFTCVEVNRLPFVVLSVLVWFGGKLGDRSDRGTGHFGIRSKG